MMYAVDHGANIINMSLGGGGDSGYATAISYATSHNVMVVMSAGNSASTDPLSPAIYAKTYGNALAVGALQLNADGTQSMASFSNLAGSGPYGYVNTAGKDVWGYGLDGNTYAWDGTSMAAPYAAAEAALILSANHSLTADQLVLAMTQTSHAVM
jgi:subtilisin family serine protease